jgi:drug/metabolite transporter (DMT)-like permease
MLQRAAFLGTAAGLLAVTIWAGWFVSTRLSLIRHLSVYDIAALRFGIGGILMLPIVLKRGFGFDKLSIPDFIILITGAGIPYVLVVSAGLIFAPAAHGAALTPGVMPIFVALIGVVLFREKLASRRRLGLAFVLSGVLALVFSSDFYYIGENTWIGDVLFVTAAFMWASFTVVLKRSGLSALHGTAIIAVTSLIIYLPIYFVFFGPTLQTLPLEEVIFAGIYQGILTSIVSLIAYNQAISRLGAARGAAFASLVPVLSAMMAVPLLGEMPTGIQWTAIACVSIGVYLASGAKMLNENA